MNNDSKDFILYSGGAYGADTEWGLIGLEYGIINQVHYRPEENIKLSRRLREKGMQPTIITNKELVDGYNALYSLYRKFQYKNLENDLKARNYFQVINSDGIYAVGTLVNGNVGGGSNVAVQLGKKLDKAIYVFNLLVNKWFEWDKHAYKFVETETPTLTNKFAGIGTRGIEKYNICRNDVWVPSPGYLGDDKSKAGIDAIRDVYELTFKNKI